METYLNREFTNEALRDEMLSGLKLAYTKKAKVNIISDSEVIIQSNHNFQVFGIKFAPTLDNFNLITFTKSLDNGQEESVTTIDYHDGEHIIVTNYKQTKLGNKASLGMENSTNVNIYRYNTLRYSKEYKYCYKYKTKLSLSSDIESSLDETFISDDNRAIRRIAKVSHDSDPSLEYYENSSYYPLPFNTSASVLQENIGAFTPTTKETFQENLESFKDKTLKIK